MVYCRNASLVYSVVVNVFFKESKLINGKR